MLISDNPNLTKTPGPLIIPEQPEATGNKTAASDEQHSDDECRGCRWKSRKHCGKRPGSWRHRDRRNTDYDWVCKDGKCKWCKREDKKPVEV